MKKKAILGILAVLVIGLVATGAVSAFRGMGFGNEETREEIQAALDAGDYDSWKEAHQNMLTEENFEKSQEMFQNREQMRANQEEIQQALEDGDYEAWQEAIANCEKARLNADDISEDEFEILVQMHEARQDGNFEIAQELAEDLDFDMPLGKGMRKGMGQGGLGNFGDHKMNMGE